MIDIINLDDCPLSFRHGSYGGQAGYKDGIIYNNEYWIVKYPKSTKGMDGVGMSYTTSPLSEYIGSQIYSILGYDVHETFLGIRNGKLVVACKDFRENDELLLELRTIKNAVNADLAKLLDESFSSTNSDHIIDLDELLLHLEHNPTLNKIHDIKERFWNCAIIDALINNNDRNNGNWGILRSEHGDRLAPIFDNGAAFSNKTSDEKISAWLAKENGVMNSALNTVTTYGRNGKKLSVKDLFAIDNPDFHESIMCVIPLIQEKLPEIYEMIDNIPEEYYGVPVCSKDRAEFYKQSMAIRLGELMVPAYEKTQRLEHELECNEKTQHKVNFEYDRDDDFER